MMKKRKEQKKKGESRLGIRRIKHEAEHKKNSECSALKRKMDNKILGEKKQNTMNVLGRQKKTTLTTSSLVCLGTEIFTFYTFNALMNNAMYRGANKDIVEHIKSLLMCIILNLATQ